jgi:hypothetical protein
VEPAWPMGWDERNTVPRRAVPESVWSATPEGYLPLHIAAGKGFFELPEFEWGDLHHDGEDVDEYVEDRLLTAHEHELHLVQFLARRAPKSVRVMSNEGMLPVHYAIASGFSLPAVRRLLEEWPEDEEHPESLQYRTGIGVPALILALDRETRSLEFAELLVQCRPRMLEDTDDHCFTPLHYAVKHCPSLETWKFLVEQRPQSLGQGDEHGCLPLHVYLFQVELAPSLEKVQYLVEQRPKAVQAADTSGSLPLHVAVSRRNVSRGIVQFLVEQRPQSLRHKNGAGLLPLHVAAVKDAPLDILYYLASKKPESIYENLLWREHPRPHKRPKLE